MAFTTRLDEAEQEQLDKIQSMLDCNTNSKTIKKMISNYVDITESFNSSMKQVIELQNKIEDFKNLVRNLSHHEHEAEKTKQDLWNLTLT